MSISSPEENPNRDPKWLDHPLPNVCSRRDCQSQWKLKIVIDRDPVPTARVLCRPHRKEYWRTSS